MARTTKPLTNTEVHQAKAKEKEFNLVDGNGLALCSGQVNSYLPMSFFMQPFSQFQ